MEKLTDEQVDALAVSGGYYEDGQWLYAESCHDDEGIIGAPMTPAVVRALAIRVKQAWQRIAELEGAIRDVQWDGYPSIDDDGSRCPFCVERPSTGHAEDCIVRAVPSIGP